MVAIWPSDRNMRVCMQSWLSQIIIGVIVTVIGTVLADALVARHHGRGFIPAISHAGPRMPGR